jgi:tetratricopeptide (TPR) repeat protein
LKVFKNGLIILLAIILAGSAVYYRIRNDTQARLNERIAHSLELNKEAAELFSEGEYLEARELLYKSLSLNRLNAETYVYLALAELELDNRRAAYEHFISALNMEATSIEIVASLADILLESGYYAEAEKYLKEGLKDFPGEGELLFRLGQAALLKGDLNSAISTLESLLAENGAYTEGYKYLGLAYYYAGEQEKAAENYGEYLRHSGLSGLENEEMMPELLHKKVLAIWGDNDRHGI